MKKTLYSVIILFFNFILYSQQVTLIKGNEKIKWLELNFSFVGANSEAFYTIDCDCLEEPLNNFKITKYSSIDMTKIYSQKIHAPSINNKKTKAEKIMLVNNIMVLFTSQYDGDNNLNRLYANKINPDGSLNPDSKFIAEIKTIDEKTKGFFNLSLSRNKKTILILSERPSDETNQIRYDWKVIDENLTILWDKSINLPYYGISSDLVVNMEYNNDKVYFVVTNLKDISIKDRRNAIAENKLFCFDFKTSKVTDVLLDVKSKSWFDLNLNFNEKNQVILTGLYSFSNTFDKQVLLSKTNVFREADGAFCSIYNENLMETIYKDSIQARMRGYLNYVNDVFIHTDGTIVMVSEDKSQSKNEYTTTYNFGTVNIFAFNYNDKTKWHKKIIKSQGDSEYELLSTLSLSNNNSLAILINDNIDNTKEQDTNNLVFQYFKLKKNAYTVIMNIDKKGYINKNLATDFSNSKNVVYCSVRCRISPNEFIVAIKTDDGNLYGKITLK